MVACLDSSCACKSVEGLDEVTVLGEELWRLDF